MGRVDAASRRISFQRVTAGTNFDDSRVWGARGGAGAEGSGAGPRVAGARPAGATRGRSSASAVLLDLVVCVLGRLELERGVFDVEMVGQALRQFVEQHVSATLGEHFRLNDHVGRENV
ncbi:MAG: hypothetical protein JWO10_1778 [Microbacteriaceae bacterium]|nr:hypothetical protein [Microbacteriaceae bacterium]